MRSWIAVVSLICAAAVHGRPPAFEVASIRPAQPSPMGQVRVRMGSDAGMLRYTNVALKDVIRTAYRVMQFQVRGPDWLGEARFDIVAKIPDGVSEDRVPEMLQALLAERFKLKLHRETREQAIYAMTPGKGGPKLKPAEVPAGDGPADGAAGPRRRGVQMMVDDAGAHLKTPAATLPVLAEMISRFSERPVVDMTGIQGQYEFDLVFSPDTVRNMPRRGGGPMLPPDGGEHSPAEVRAGRAGSIYDSVERYGLKLEPRKAPVEVLVIDHIEKTPTEN